MFHDRFVQADHGFFPFWLIVPPERDEQDTSVWIDPESNILVVLFETPLATPSGMRHSRGIKLEETRAVFEMGSSRELIVLSTERDTLIAMSTDAKTDRKQCLQPGAARRIRLALRDRAEHASIAPVLETSNELPSEVRASLKTMHVSPP